MANEPIITIVGNMTGDPELRYVSSGKPVANLTVAVTPKHLNRQTSAWEDGEATFYRCTVWNGAENVADTLRKGMRVIVTGKLSTRAWTADNGKTGTSIEIAVDEIGPALRWAKAQVVKTGNAQHGQPQKANNTYYAQQNTFSGPATTPAWQDADAPF